jgi:hypothetical protein
LRVGGNVLIGLANMSLLHADLLLPNHDRCLALLMAGEGEMESGVQSRRLALTSSPLWWNSVLETERAGVRMASRFMRTTKLISVLVWGDVFALIIQSGSADLDKSNVISASIEDQLLQPGGIQRLVVGRNGRFSLEANPLHGWMIFKFHGRSFYCICNYMGKKSACPGLIADSFRGLVQLL